MKAEEARKISFAHSERMQKLYKMIENSAKHGNGELGVNTADATKAEMEVLQNNGYVVSYETSEIDGGQWVLIKW